jgi:WD40 repeat protein
MLKGYSDSMWVVCWYGTWDQFILGSLDGLVRVWDISRQKCLIILHGYTNAVRSVASSSNSLFVVSGSKDRTVKVYDTQSSDVLQTISTDSLVLSVQFSTHDDKLLYMNRISNDMGFIQENAGVKDRFCGILCHILTRWNMCCIRG